MPSPFDKDFDQRRQWWDDHLWLQMIGIAAIAVLAIVVVYGPSVLAFAAAGVWTALIYVLARTLIRLR